MALGAAQRMTRMRQLYECLTIDTGIVGIRSGILFSQESLSPLKMPANWSGSPATCGAEMKIISVITDSRLVDRILRHLQSPACTTRDPFQPRPPPATSLHLP